jgi:hypothetical protein
LTSCHKHLVIHSKHLTIGRLLVQCDRHTLRQTPQRPSEPWCESMRWRPHWSSLSTIAPVAPDRGKIILRVRSTLLCS